MEARLHETHISIVLLLGDRAYKLKKPVKTGFLDYSTRELRQAACAREVELNRRLAPDVYLGVVDVLGLDGAPCDHLVAMRRLPQERCLEDLVVAGAATADDITRLARAVADFHARAARSPAIDEAASQAAVLRNWEDNLDESSPYAGSVLDAEAMGEVEHLARRFVSGRGALFAQRAAHGLVVDGHGDLRAANVFCLDDGPRILDCVEFSDRLRHGDVLLDVAFLAMDLERLGAPDLSRQLLASYREFTAETHPIGLLEHYVAYRALVRAKVACMRHEQGDPAAAGAARSLLGLCAAHLRRGRVRLVLVGGAPGTGKSTLAEGIGEEAGFAVLRSDVVRKELAGIAAEERGGAELYTDAHTEATYAELLRRAGELLELGESVVLDATWRERGRREAAAAVADAAAADLVQLRATLPPGEVAARVRRRQAARSDASDADEGVAARLAEEFDAWPEASDVSTSGDPAQAVARVVARLER